MPNPGFWAAYAVIGLIVWALSSRFLTRSLITGYDALGVVVVWPPYLALLAWSLCGGKCGK